MSGYRTDAIVLACTDRQAPRRQAVALEPRMKHVHTASLRDTKQHLRHAACCICVSCSPLHRAEERFFAGKPEYRDVLTQCGITNLARRLNALLAEHIRALLPTLRRGIAESLEARMTELRGLGEPLK